MKLRVVVTGVARTITSKGKDHTFSEVWAYLPNMPFPVQVDVYGSIDLAAGEYDVPVLFEARDRRLSAGFNFRQASVYKGA